MVCRKLEKNLWLVILSRIQYDFERERFERFALAFVEFALKFDPMQPECVQERRETFHAEKYGDC